MRAQLEGGGVGIGDRVVQKANDYNLEIFNGSLGTVRAIDKEGILIDFDLEGEECLFFSPFFFLQVNYTIIFLKSQHLTWDV